MVSNFEIVTYGPILMDIIACALKNETYSGTCDYEAIYKLASYHHVEGITYLGLKNQQNEWVEKLKKQYDQIQLKVLYFEMEREKIYRLMRKHNLSYLPLKGINLLKCYPDCGMRFMSDNDIMYGYIKNSDDGYYRDETSELQAQEVMNQIMKSLGYKIYINQAKDDVYTKDPFFVFEMHKRLVNKSSPMIKYYENPWNKTIRSKEDAYCYQFKIDDEFIYMIYHAYKHFELAGFGIRYLIDIYYFLEKYQKEMNFTYIKQEFAVIGCNEFYERSLKLCMNGFKKQMDDQDLKMLYYLLGSGTYGTVGQQVVNQLKKQT